MWRSREAPLKTAQSEILLAVNHPSSVSVPHAGHRYFVGQFSNELIQGNPVGVVVIPRRVGRATGHLRDSLHHKTNQEIVPCVKESAGDWLHPLWVPACILEEATDNFLHVSHKLGVFLRCRVRSL